MNIFFIIMIGFAMLSLGINLAKHGETKETKYNFWVALISEIIEITVIYFAIKTGF